jgi:hypothetical protein
MTAMLTPIDHGAARPSGTGKLWRKQLLPVGSIDYKGRKIDFSREYLAGLARAFAAKAYDQVPFQLADGQNTHTNDPERFRGDIRGLELTADGLDLILAPTEDGEKVLRANPNLGVSARIVEDYQRADGKFFPAAIQHVLGTLDPRIPGMRPWQAVEAANDDEDDVIDLTALDATDAGEDTAPPEDPTATKETSMALTSDQEARLSRLLDLPDDQFDALLTAAPEAEGTEDGDEGAEDEPQLSDAELQALLDEIEADGAEDATEGAEPELEPAGVALSQDAQAAIDLANARQEETALQLARVTSQLARTAYEAERDTWQRTLGIPARITDLARPLLEGEGRVVDLANGRTADAGAIVRKLITEFGQTMKALNLSVELGTSEDGGDDAQAKAEQEAAERKQLVSSVRSMTGI